MKRAIISVSDKTGVVEFAKGLTEYGYEIISTGGTAKALTDAGIKVIGISEITGFPECLDGRVKTLDPHIFAGILAKRDDKNHMKQIKDLEVDTIDIVAVNLYPFKQTILKSGVTREEAIENIDIGGPSMLRAAAKNYKDVAVIVDPNHYSQIIKELKELKEICPTTKFNLAYKVFEYTAHYDAMIANYLKEQNEITEYPENLTLTYEKIQDLRYGENPHQAAAFYREIGNKDGVLTNAVQLHGKELSFNNINDTNGALELLKEYDEPTIVACKHANPCGVGSAKNIYDAYMKAYNSDPVSIFGGIITSNREIDAKTATEINKIFIEILLAPSFTDEALEILKKKQNIRLLKVENIKKMGADFDVKKVSGGLLIQNTDSILVDDSKLEVVTKRKPTDQEMEDLLFTWKIVKHTKSNGIAIGKDKQSVGVGPGQVNRIWATKQAIEHGIDALGKDATKGAVLASDAFFPFSDCAEEAAKAGITAIIQPGGSVKDQDSIDLCNKHNIAMVFTQVRHFKH